MEQENLEEQIVALVGAPGYRPMKPRGLLKELRLDDSRYGELRRLVKRLVRAGKLRFAANHLLLPPLPSVPLEADSSSSDAPSRSQDRSSPGSRETVRSGLQRREPPGSSQPILASEEEPEAAEAMDQSEASPVLSQPTRRDGQQVAEGIFRST
ncbi:MAG: hypothetical protein ACOVNV_09930, partial [Pirellulaceae bacterium]